MDIDYLLLLQNFREATNDFFSPFLIWVSDFTLSVWPVAMMCMVYWVFDRKEGRRILAGYGAGVFMSGFLKLVFRITRPWLRDDRIVPYGDSIVTATGFSFPSGHTAVAVATYGGVALWTRKRSKLLTALLVTMTVLLMFSRNYLGVHTPQDVLAAPVFMLLMMFLVHKVEDWTDKDIRRDWVVLAAGLIACAALAVYCGVIQIDPVYDAAGRLMVDPPKMLEDSYEGIGFVGAFVICRLIERRCFHFDARLKKKDRFILCTFALIPLYWWYNTGSRFLLGYSSPWGRIALQAVTVVYVMLIVPLVLEKIKLPKWMREE